MVHAVAAGSLRDHDRPRVPPGADPLPAASSGSTLPGGYRTTILSDETDPDKLHDLKADLDRREVYTEFDVDTLAELYLGGADRDQLDPILDASVATYKDTLDEDGQVDFKGKAKAFVRSYDFLAPILPYTHADWETVGTRGM